MQNAQILIVDDNRDLAEGLKAGFEEEGYAVSLAHTAENALELFESADFDITFMDVKLPGLDGINAMTKILETKPAARIVVMSGYKIEPLLNEAVNRGAISILQKPFSVEQALTLVQSS